MMMVVERVWEEGDWGRVGGWGSSSSGRRGGRIAELCRRSGTMCMEWGRDEVEEIWREEGGGVGQGWAVARR